MNLVLRPLTLADEKAFLLGLEEWRGESPHWYSFLWQDGMTYPQMLERLRKDSVGEDLPEGRVAHSMLYGFVDGAIIGRVSIRHELNEKLKVRGGHLGYSVAPKFRSQGYASAMVVQALEFCRGLKLESIMITCTDTNVHSWKIIEKMGGKLQDKIFDETDQETIRRYWLNL